MKTIKTDFMPFEKQLKWYWKWLGFKYYWILLKDKAKHTSFTHEVSSKELYWLKLRIKTFKYILIYENK